jgi:predicted metal-dependent hydrolase
MAEQIVLGDISIALTRKEIKHVHLSVHPPNGRVTMVVPMGTRLAAARAYAISKLRWIKGQRLQLLSQPRETARAFVNRESHSLWGRRYLLTVREAEERPSVVAKNRKLVLTVRPGASKTKRAEVMHEWHKQLLHEAVGPLLAKWQAKLGVRASAYFLQRMKTKWGACNHRAGNIRLNTELVKKPKDLLEYVIVHELMHLIEPKHSDRFMALMDLHYPHWREARSELNALPLSAEAWSE